MNGEVEGPSPDPVIVPNGGSPRRAPLFFLSYAHSAEGEAQIMPRERNRAFFQFFDDLSENVAELVSREPGSDPGYMDKSIGGGTHWQPELLEAIGTCQVFVALLSVRYYTSAWCGREWYAFSRRKVLNHTGGTTKYQAVIVPVLWAAPIPRQQVPSAVSELQIFTPKGLPNPNIATLYAREGVVGLIQMRLDDIYQAVVWKLAQHIADLQYRHWVEPHVLSPDELRNFF